MTRPDGTPELLRLPEAAALFAVGPDAVKRWCLAGKLGYRRTLGGHIRVVADDVYAWLNGEGELS